MADDWHDDDDDDEDDDEQADDDEPTEGDSWHVPQSWEEWMDFDWETYDGDYEEFAVSADYEGE